MGVFTHVTEFTSVVPPSRLFKGLVLDADNLITKIAPQIFKGVEYLEGDGGVGTVKKIIFAEGGYMKHKVDALDKDNFVFHYSLIEGDAITEKIEKVCYEVKFAASTDGGSDIKNTSHYHAKDNFEIKEEDVKAGEEKANGFFKLIEGYLVANPDVYN